MVLLGTLNLNISKAKAQFEACRAAAGAKFRLTH
jgi:hypothetical protein